MSVLFQTKLLRQAASVLQESELKDLSFAFTPTGELQTEKGVRLQKPIEKLRDSGHSNPATKPRQEDIGRVHADILAGGEIFREAVRREQPLDHGGVGEAWQSEAIRIPVPA